MKKVPLVEVNCSRATGSGHVRKATTQRKPKGQTARLSPLPTGAAAKLAGLLGEHCLAPETVTAHLRLYWPQAHEVFVAGSFNDWQLRATRLIPRPDGEWTVDLILKPGRYEYRYVVDGQWMDDPMTSRFAVNPFGGLNSVVDVQPSA